MAKIADAAAGSREKRAEAVLILVCMSSGHFFRAGPARATHFRKIARNFGSFLLGSMMALHGVTSTPPHLLIVLKNPFHSPSYAPSSCRLSVSLVTMDKIPNPFKNLKRGDSGGAENPLTDLAQKTAEAVEKGAQATTAIAEKGVKAVDPLHVFDPSPIPTRLMLDHGLFDRINPDPFPILEARSNKSFHNLAVEGKKAASDVLVLEDTSSKKPVLVMDRTPSPRLYDIYKTTPMKDGQAIAKTENGLDLYLRAKVVMSDKDLHVFLEGESDPVYIITKAPGLFNMSTQRVILLGANKEKVANLSNWDATSYMLEISPGIDAGLMLCLGIISDDNALE